jgi:hypothetical protein
MKQEKINVLLKNIDDHDLLVFEISSGDKSKDLSINLNSDNCQSEIKKVFSSLLEKMINSEIQLELKIDPQYSKGLYIDVCKEYITNLNREIEQIHNELVIELAK